MYNKYNNKFKSDVMTIFAGEYYIGHGDVIISTVLGSCISVCLYDSTSTIGGMNHFMLPHKRGQVESESLFVDKSQFNKDKLNDDSLKYGITAMEVLIAEMQKRGALRKNLRAKIFGGGKVLNRQSELRSVGETNIIFAKTFLDSERIPIDNENIGNTWGRKIFFLIEKNAIFVKKIDIRPAEEEDQVYMEELMKKKEKSNITLF